MIWIKSTKKTQNFVNRAEILIYALVDKNRVKGWKL